MPRPLAWGLGVWGAVLLASLIPLPFGALEVLSPAAAEVRSMGPPGEATRPGWAPLHLAPGVGAFRVLRWAAITAFVAACSARMGSPRFRRLLPLGVVGALGLGLLITGLQTALGARQVAGLWDVRWDVRGELLTPLVNENHWAALLALGGPLALFIPSRVGTPARVAAVATGILATGFVLLGPSRSGLVGLLVAATVIALLRTGVRGRAALGLTLATALALGFALRGGDVVRYADTGAVAEHADPLGKVAALPEVWGVVADHPLTGTGAGAFVDVFPGRRGASLDDLPVHAENLPLQALADHGLLLGGALLLLLGWGLATCLREARDPARVAATAGLVGLAVHELADFATHTGVVALCAGASAVYVLGVRERVPGARRGHRLAFVAVIGGLLATAPLLPDRSLDATQGRMAERFEAGEATWDEVAAAMYDARPASFVAAQEIGVGYARRGDPQALRWMNRAQLLAPGHPSPHLWTARVLRRLGAKDQALIEYRRVLDLNWRYQGRAVVEEVATKYDGARPLVRLAGHGDSLRAARVAWELFQLQDPRASEVAEVAATGSGPLSRLVLARARILRGAPREGVEVARRALQHPELTPWLRARLVEHIDEAEAQLALLEP